MLSMLCLVVVFGIHSLADWTWYVPGNACVALLCAGWLAGRGPLAPGPSPDARSRRATIAPTAATRSGAAWADPSTRRRDRSARASPPR